MYHITLEVSHSIFVSGVSDSCLKIFVFLYSEDMLTIENIGLTSMAKPIKPGTKKVNVFGLLSVHRSLGYTDDGCGVLFVIVQIEIVYNSINCPTYDAAGA